MLDHLRALAVFSKVADRGSFRGAAQELGLSASVVSHHVTALERFVDTPLIYRSTRKLSLTAAGKQLLTSAHAMLEAAQEGFGNIGRETTSFTGRLSITAPAILQYARFVTRMATFSKHHPKIDLKVSFSDRQSNIIEEGFDLALRIGWLSDSSLKSRKLAEGRLVLCASPQYLSEFANPTEPAELETLEMIELEGTPTTLDLAAKQGNGKRKVRMNCRLTVDSGFAAKRMAREGCGVVMLPDFFVSEDLADGSLTEVLPDWSAPSFGIFAVWPDNRGSNALRSAFVDYVGQIAKTNPDMDRVMA